MLRGKKEKKTPEKVDPQLDAPSVANQEKHINFLAEEAREVPARNDSEKEDIEERKREWREGIEEGKEEQDKKLPFEKRDLNENEEY